MKGRIVTIEKDKTTIVTEDKKIIEVNTLFMPLKFVSGDFVEIEDNNIVLRA